MDILENIRNTIKDIEVSTNLTIKYIIDGDFINILVFKNIKDFEVINRYDDFLGTLKFLQGFKRSIMMIQINDLIIKH